MKIALSTDEWHPIHEFIQTWLKDKGHEILLYGSYKTHQDVSWVDSTFSAAEAVSKGQCDQAILCCWTGTGASIAANKVKGIRAALCFDVETVSLANIWNHANALVLPNRILTPDLTEEMLNAWFEPYDSTVGIEEIQKLKDL